MARGFGLPARVYHKQGRLRMLMTDKGAAAEQARRGPGDGRVVIRSRQLQPRKVHAR